MPTNQPYKNYEDRLNRVLTYIYDHLDEELSLDTLAEIACVSRYHWHRVFKAMTGESLAEVVRRLRLNKAANALLQENDSVREIAQNLGYKNLASFSRAFKKEHGFSPNEFRERGIAVSKVLKLNEGTDRLYPLKIKEFPPSNAAGVLHNGAYQQIGKAFKNLGGTLMANSLMEDVEMLFVIYHDAPESKPSSELRSHVAVTIRDSFPKDLQGIDYFNVEGGKYAVLEHKGPYATLKFAYEWLYGKWLPASDFEPRNAPPLEIYINDPKVTPSAELRTDIRLPLL